MSTTIATSIHNDLPCGKNKQTNRKNQPSPPKQQQQNQKTLSYIALFLFSRFLEKISNHHLMLIFSAFTYFSHALFCTRVYLGCFPYHFKFKEKSLNCHKNPREFDKERAIIYYMRFCHCMNHDIYFIRRLVVPIFCCGKYQSFYLELWMPVPLAPIMQRNVNNIGEILIPL